MDVLPRVTRQLIDLFRTMSPALRVISVAVPLSVLAGFGWLVAQTNRTDFQPVSFGKQFSPEELVSAEHALTTAGLRGFQHEGNRILVPAKELDKYNAALLEFDAFPADLGSQMLKQYETLGPFSTDRQRQQMKEALLLQELRRMIKAVPDVEDARVAFATSDRRSGWNQKPRTTANVTIKPRGGREISTTLINSLRHVVANMVPDLKPADVTVFDVTRGQAYTGEPTDDPSDSQYLQRAREFTRQYERQIQKALSHIPNVSVTVHVDLDALKSSMTRSETVRSRREPVQVANRAESWDEIDIHSTGFRGTLSSPTETTHEVTEKQLVAAMPKAVQVSVSIPCDYLREIRQRALSKGTSSPSRLDPNNIEEEVLTTVERIVGRLIPAHSPPEAVSVTFVDRMISDIPVGAVELTSPTSPIERRWMIAGVIGGLVLIGLWVVRSKPATAVIAPAPTALIEIDEPSAAPFPELAMPTAPTFVAPARASILRDEIRSLVASDPAASAALLGRWLAEA